MPRNNKYETKHKSTKSLFGIKKKIKKKSTPGEGGGFDKKIFKYRKDGTKRKEKRVWTSDASLGHGRQKQKIKYNKDGSVKKVVDRYSKGDRPVGYRRTTTKYKKDGTVKTKTPFSLKFNKGGIVGSRDMFTQQYD